MLLSLLACGQSTPTEEPPTWNEDVAPIVAEHCGSCHVSGGIAPFPLESYADASSMASSMVAAVEAGTMPPWGAETTDECEPRYGFMDDPRLSDEEKATLAAWADGGAPEGSGPLAELPASPDLSLADPDQVLAPDTAYVTSGDSDEFRCFVLDPGLNEDAWLTGLQVEAGNEAVVHHVLAFADPDRASEKLVGSDGTYDCFGGPGFNDTALLGAWAPGGKESVTKPGFGTRLEAGQRELCMQAVIAWEARHLPPDERVGHIDRGSKSGGDRCATPAEPEVIRIIRDRGH